MPPGSRDHPPVPGEQLADPPGWMIGQPGEHVGEPAFGSMSLSRTSFAKRAIAQNIAMSGHSYFTK
jgi:hypothetical protein